MDAVKQRVRAAVARKKEEEKKAKGKDGTSSLVPKAVYKGSTKRKTNGDNDRLPKKVAVTPGDAYSEKTPPKSGPSAGKGMMTSASLVIEGPRCLITHKDYAVEEVKTLIKPMDVDPCAKLGTEELGESALFDLTQVTPLPWLILSCLLLFVCLFVIVVVVVLFYFIFFTDNYTFLQALVHVKAL